jgi:hypothetical protein
MKRKNLLRQTVLTISLSSYLALTSTFAQNKTDTLKLYADKTILNFKGKKLGLNGGGLRLFEIGNNHTKSNSIILHRDNSKELVTVFIVIDYQNVNRSKAEFYIIIDGQKHYVDLSCYLEFNSKYDKKDYFVLKDGSLTTKYMHCDHYSHSSHYSSSPSLKNK